VATLFHTPDRKRWFLVPEGVALSEGALRVRRFAGPERSADETIDTYEIGEREAKAWIEARISAGFVQAEDAVLKFFRELRERLRAARRKGSAARRPKKLLRVGFFAELPHGDPHGVKLADAQRPEAHPQEALVVRYLQQAPVLIGSPGPVRDVLAPDSGYIGTRSIHTDGVWCWPGDLAHYVETYHVALPDAFLEHGGSRRWRHVLFDPNVLFV
jgi:hypothetical protein